MAITKPTFTIIEDSREQNPLDFSPFAAALGFAVERTKLRTGDYSVKGYQNHIFIERKSLTDCVSTLTHGRKRFTREIYDRASYYPVRALIIEADWSEISRPYHFSAANPLSIVNSLHSLMLPPASMQIFADHSRARIAWWVATFCANFVRRVTHGSSGMWDAIFAPDSADLAPIPAPYETIH